MKTVVILFDEKKNMSYHDVYIHLLFLFGLCEGWQRQPRPNMSSTQWQINNIAANISILMYGAPKEILEMNVTPKRVKLTQTYSMPNWAAIIMRPWNFDLLNLRMLSKSQVIQRNSLMVFLMMWSSAGGIWSIVQSSLTPSSMWLGLQLSVPVVLQSPK